MKNELIVPDVHPMPRIDDPIDQIGTALPNTRTDLSRIKLTLEIHVISSLLTLMVGQQERHTACKVLLRAYLSGGV